MFAWCCVHEPLQLRLKQPAAWQVARRRLKHFPASQQVYVCSLNLDTCAHIIVPQYISSFIGACITYWGFAHFYPSCCFHHHVAIWHACPQHGRRLFGRDEFMQALK